MRASPAAPLRPVAAASAAPPRFPRPERRRRSDHAVSVPLEAMKQALMGMGASSDVAGMYAEMTGAINDGKVAWEGGSALHLRGEIGLEQTLKALLG